MSQSVGILRLKSGKIFEVRNRSLFCSNDEPVSGKVELAPEAVEQLLRDSQNLSEKQAVKNIEYIIQNNGCTYELNIKLEGAPENGEVNFDTISVIKKHNKTFKSTKNRLVLFLRRLF